MLVGVVVVYVWVQILLTLLAGTSANCFHRLIHDCFSFLMFIAFLSAFPSSLIFWFWPTVLHYTKLSLEASVCAYCYLLRTVQERLVSCLHVF